MQARDLRSSASQSIDLLVEKFTELGVLLLFEDLRQRLLRARAGRLVASRLLFFLGLALLSLLFLLLLFLAGRFSSRGVLRLGPSSSLCDLLYRLRLLRLLSCFGLLKLLFGE